MVKIEHYLHYDVNLLCNTVCQKYGKQNYNTAPIHNPVVENVNDI